MALCLVSAANLPSHCVYRFSYISVDVLSAEQYDCFSTGLTTRYETHGHADVFKVFRSWQRFVAAKSVIDERTKGLPGGKLHRVILQFCDMDKSAMLWRTYCSNV